MKWASSVSDHADLDRAVAVTTGEVAGQLAGAAADLVLVFVSSQHASRFPELPGAIRKALPAGVLIGCSAGGVIGGAREIEQAPGLALTAASLPDVTIRAFRLKSDDLPGSDAGGAAWETAVGSSGHEEPHFLLLPDPFSFDTENLLRGLDLAFPRAKKIGGLASGGRHPGSHALFLDSTVQRSGLVGVALAGNVEVATIVAQGCRPIGDPMFVTRSDRNVLWELDGVSPLKALQRLHERLDSRDQELFRHSLFVGIAMNDDQGEYHQGDFLIRNLAGVDPTSGALAVGGLLRENGVVQFHLRDAKTSGEDLEMLLPRLRPGSGVRPSGSLLFSCLGRGRQLYGLPDYETQAFRRHFGEIPLGGFFCNGEIGPVHGTTFLHGYSSSFAVFSPRS